MSEHLEVNPLMFVDAVRAWRNDDGTIRLDPAEVQKALPEAVFEFNDELIVDYAVVGCVLLEAVAILAEQVEELICWKNQMTGPLPLTGR